MVDRAAGSDNRRKKFLRRLGLGMGSLMLVFLTAVGPCTITHKFGPYHGQVVEDVTGEPIEGALVLMVFFTEMYTPGGFTTHFVEALETTTDAKGEFSIPAFRAWAFRVPHKWDDIAPVTIFKPGYGAYDMRYMPQDEHVTIRLPRLKTREERLRNLRRVIPGNVPDGKLGALLEMEKKEAKDLDLPE
jgi:hypothetical protein